MRIQRLIKPFVPLVMVWTFLAFGLVPAYGQDAKEEECTGLYKGREKPTKEDHAKILQAHEEWVDSRGAKGKKADLCEAHLFQAHLQKANLDWAHLQGANLEGAHLQQADLRGAHLEEASLFQANLQKANLRGANLEKAVLDWAHLE